MQKIAHLQQNMKKGKATGKPAQKLIILLVVQNIHTIIKQQSLYGFDYFLKHANVQPLFWHIVVD